MKGIMKYFKLLFLLLNVSMFFTRSILCDISYLQQSALSELLVVESHPIVQLQFTYNINADLIEQTQIGSSSMSQSNGMAVLSTSDTGDVKLLSKIRAYAQPGQGISCIFTAVYDGAASSNTSQIAGVGNSSDGFFFEYSNSTFYILFRNNSVDSLISQSSWNVDPMDGTGPSGVNLNFTNGNVFKIQYPWLGFGNVNFFIESPLTGEMVLVHQIQYANTAVVPLVSNLGLQLMAEVVSTNGSAQLEVASMGMLVEGEVNSFLGIRNNVSADNSVNATLTNILTIQNNTIFNSQLNQVMVLPDQVSLFNSSGGGGDAIFSLYLNPTVDGQSFSEVGANSVVQYDTNGTNVTGGTLLGTFFLSSGSDITLNLCDCGIKLSPSDSLVIACAATSSTITVYASVSWIELF